MIPDSKFYEYVLKIRPKYFSGIYQKWLSYVISVIIEFLLFEISIFKAVIQNTVITILLITYPD